MYQDHRVDRYLSDVVRAVWFAEHFAGSVRNRFLTIENGLQLAGSVLHITTDIICHRDLYVFVPHELHENRWHNQLGPTEPKSPS
ncbi:MAG: hypothetical protein ABGX16_00025 [Pirellulales bacterium]